jgi:hypothetical protein
VLLFIPFLQSVSFAESNELFNGRKKEVRDLDFKVKAPIQAEVSNRYVGQENVKTFATEGL